MRTEDEQEMKIHVLNLSLMSIKRPITAFAPDPKDRVKAFAYERVSTLDDVRRLFYLDIEWNRYREKM